MIERIAELFEDPATANKIKKKLPELFWLAELESRRAGKTGMEVGFKRIMIPMK